MRIPMKKTLALAGAGIAATASYEIFCPKATLWGRVIIRGERSHPAVSIVFDKSPNSSTEAISKKLHELHSPATFFIEERRARIYERALKALRPFELGIHGERYNPLIFKKKQDILHLIEPSFYRASDIQGRKVSYLMPPYGWKNFRLISAAGMLGLRVINPTHKLALGAPVTEYFINRIQPGDIILLSWKNGPSETDKILSQLETLMDGIKKKGLSIWGLSALLSPYL